MGLYRGRSSQGSGSGFLITLELTWIRCDEETFGHAQTYASASSKQRTAM